MSTQPPIDAERWRKLWSDQRRDALETYGLWEHYGQVPPVEQRARPLAEYLPGGTEYDVE